MIRSVAHPLISVLLALFLVFSIVGASANTIYVVPGGTGNGSKWNNALGSVNEAAAIAAFGDQVWVAAGTYNGTQAVVPLGVTLFGGFAGGETKLSQRNPNANVTILDGDGGSADGNYAVVSFAAQGGPFQGIDGFTIQHGNTGVYINGGDPVISNNVITENIGVAGGLYSSGIFCVYGSPKVTGNVIRHNHSWGDGGGLLFLFDGNGQTSVIGNTVTDNISDRNAGGISFYDCTSVLVTSNIVSRNTCAGFAAGGITLFSDTFPPSAAISFVANNIVQNNTSLGGDIGGIDDFAVPAYISGNLVTGNTGGACGGIKVTNCSTTVSNNTIAGNFAPGAPWGEPGAALVVTENVSVVNNIVALNRTAGLISSSYDPVSSNCFYGNTGGETYLNGNLYTDPHFTDAIGGEYHLLNISRCIGAGDNSVPGYMAADLDNSPRFQQGIIDIGCYESHYAPDVIPPVTTTTKSPAPIISGSGWNNSDVQVTLSATDPAPGTGVAATYFTLDGGPQQTYTTSFTVSGEGIHTVRFWSVDGWGNVEAAKSAAINIDLTPPITSASTSGSKTVLVTLNAADNLSGPQQTYYYLTGPDGVQGARKLYSPGSPISVSNIGINTITYWSIDAAGNTEALHSIKFEVGTPKLQAVLLSVERERNGWSITVGLMNSGTATARNVIKTSTTVATNLGDQTFPYPETIGDVSAGSTVVAFQLRIISVYFSSGKTYKVTLSGTYGGGTPWSSTVNVTFP